MKIIHLFTKRPDGREDWQWMTWRWEDQYQDLYNQLRTFRRGPVVQESDSPFYTYPLIYGSGGGGSGTSTITRTGLAEIRGWHPSATTATTTISWQDVLRNALIKKRNKP